MATAPEHIHVVYIQDNKTNRVRITTRVDRDVTKEYIKRQQVKGNDLIYHAVYALTGYVNEG